jgi:Hint module
LTYWESVISLSNITAQTGTNGTLHCDALGLNFNVYSEDYRDTCINFGSTISLRRKLLQVLPNEETRLPLLRSLVTTTCITNCTDLRKSVKSCTRRPNPNPSDRCRIDVCARKLKCRKSIPSDTYDPIDLSNKAIIFNCTLDCPTARCEIDGGGDNQLFIGSNAQVHFNRFKLTNSKGGAIRLWGRKHPCGDIERSNLQLSDCSFVNNNALSGSTISLNDTDVLMEGVSTSFVNNVGYGAPIAMFSSTAHLVNAYFEGNNATKSGTGIFSFDSTINFGNVTFIKPGNRSTQDAMAIDCDVLVAISAKDFTRNTSCIKLKTRSSIRPELPGCPGIPTPTPEPEPTVNPSTAPSLKPKPTSAPASAPTPSCFSGWNIVEVKDVGYIRMDQLAIGDYVRSGDGEFTIVYGFGHLDRQIKATFLQIAFNGTDNSVPLEVSDEHLLMINTDQLIQPIRASEVSIGDWLNGRQVLNIRTVDRLGVYAPLTYSGDLMVSEVHGSNYVAVLDHEWIWDQHSLGHVLHLPQRMFCCYFMEVCMYERYVNGYGYVAYLVVQVGSVINFLHRDYDDNTLSILFLAIASVTICVLRWFKVRIQLQ